MKYFAVLSSLLFVGQAMAEQTVFECKTNKHFIIVSKSTDNRFHYQAWNFPKTKPDKADAELFTKDAMTTEGTGPCFTTYYTFPRGNIEYIVSDNIKCAEKNPPAGAHGRLIVKINKQVKSDFWCLEND